MKERLIECKENNKITLKRKRKVDKRYKLWYLCEKTFVAI